LVTLLRTNLVNFIVFSTLAHNGVLFLDELPEFKRTVLEVMRQPMEERIVTIARARLSADKANTTGAKFLNRTILNLGFFFSV